MLRRPSPELPQPASQRLRNDPTYDSSATPPQKMHRLRRRSYTPIGTPTTRPKSRVTTLAALIADDERGGNFRPLARDSERADHAQGGVILDVTLIAELPGYELD